MKREHIMNSVCAAGMAFLLALGTAGCMVTGLRLEVPEFWWVAWVCGAAALVGAVCFRFRWGGACLLSVLALASWFVWRQEEPVQQLLSMLSRILRLYDGGYGWGIPRFLAAVPGTGSVRYPIAAIAVAVALAVSYCVCRQKGISLVLVTAGIPFASCFVVTDTVPEERYLYLWMLGALLLVLTGNTRRRSLSQGNELTALAVLPAALALGVLFLAVPRAEYDKHPEKLQETILNWVQQMPERLEDVAEDLLSGEDGSQESGRMNLRTIGPKTNLTYPVMEVRAMGNGTMYLREQDYDTYTGTGWTVARMRSEKFPESDLQQDAGAVTIRTRSVRDALLLPYYPAETVTLSEGRRRNDEDLKEYTIQQRLLDPQWRQKLEGSGSAAKTDHAAQLYICSQQSAARYLALPNQTRVWAQDQVKKILSGERTATEAADAIARYVQNSAEYDLDTRWMPAEETDFARWFLEQSDTGYCVHFATAAVVLLRGAGIEARYVEGYMFTAEYDTFVTVTADKAHAWAEYYEPLVGAWIVLEATPADPDDQEAAAGTQTDPPFTVPDFTVPETTAAPQPTAPTVPQAKPQPGIPGETQPDAQPEPALPDWVATAVVRLFVIAALMAAVPGQRTLRLWLRGRRRQQGNSNARALRRWRELVRLYRRLGRTPPEAMEQLAQKAKYSRHVLSAEELGSMDTEIIWAQACLKQRAWYKKLIDKYIFALY